MLLKTNEEVDMIITTLSTALKERIKQGGTITVNMLSPEFDEQTLQWDAETPKYFIRNQVKPGMVTFLI